MRKWRTRNRSAATCFKPCVRKELYAQFSEWVVNTCWNRNRLHTPMQLFALHSAVLLVQTTTVNNTTPWKHVPTRNEQNEKQEKKRHHWRRSTYQRQGHRGPIESARPSLPNRVGTTLPPQSCRDDSPSQIESGRLWLPNRVGVRADFWQ